MDPPASSEAAVTARIAAAPLDIQSRRRARALVRAACDGSGGAIDTLVRQHWPDLYRAALLITHDTAAAEDIAQEAMLAALDQLERFDRRRSLGPWLHRIVVNRAIDHLRAEGRRADLIRRAGTREEHGQQHDLGDPGLSGELVTALDALSAEDRAIVVLRHLLDYRSAEIARMLGLRAGSVRRRLKEALDRIRLELDEKATR